MKKIIKTVDGNRYEITADAEPCLQKYGETFLVIVMDGETKLVNARHIVSVTIKGEGG